MDLLVFFRRWRYRILAAGILLLSVGGVGGFKVFKVVSRSQRLSTAYQTIQIGDTRDRLVELAGPPQSLGASDDPSRAYSLQIRYEDYRYDYLYQSYYYAFDRDGKLIQKVSCALAEYCSKVDR